MKPGAKYRGKVKSGPPAPLIVHVLSASRAERTVCGLDINSITGRQSVEEFAPANTRCVTCESIRKVYGESA